LIASALRRAQFDRASQQQVKQSQRASTDEFIVGYSFGFCRNIKPFWMAPLVISSTSHARKQGPLGILAMRRQESCLLLLQPPALQLADEIALQILAGNYPVNAITKMKTRCYVHGSYLKRFL
jgi:hypothetical protein